MKKLFAITALALVSLLHVPANAEQIRVPQNILLPSTGGLVQGTRQHSDQFMWGKFAEAVKPVASVPGKIEFLTWASDNDVYRVSPAWPAAGAARTFDCGAATNPYVSGFPVSGCIAEEVYRNRVQYDYIVDNGIYTKAGLASFFASDKTVTMPKASISVKSNWVPVANMLQWVSELKTADDVRRNYYVYSTGGVEYALVAMHLASAWNPEWVWATFEHELNPGRCDTTGCYDRFGARKKVVAPNFKVANTQYGKCLKSDAALRAFANAGIAEVFRNYCLKSSMVSPVSASGRPIVMANSVTERITANVELTSSCMGCHAYAAFGSSGSVTPGAAAMLGYSPVGRVFPAALQGAKTYHFMWGLLNAP